MIEFQEFDGAVSAMFNTVRYNDCSFLLKMEKKEKEIDSLFNR
jgi:hypothetical protein